MLDAAVLSEAKNLVLVVPFHLIRHGGAVTPSPQGEGLAGGRLPPLRKVRQFGRNGGTKASPYREVWTFRGMGERGRGKPTPCGEVQKFGGTAKAPRPDGADI